MDIERQKNEVWPNMNERFKDTLSKFSLNGTIQKRPEFNPHVTFSKRFEDNLVEIPKFEEDIVLYAPSFKFKY